MTHSDKGISLVINQQSPTKACFRSVQSQQLSFFTTIQHKGYKVPFCAVK